MKDKTTRLSSTQFFKKN